MRIPLPEQGHSLITYLAFAKSYEKITTLENNETISRPIFLRHTL